jgi:L-ascorbate metabolism protein UlaG (beta-lactamase superfamily)
MTNIIIILAVLCWLFRCGAQEALRVELLQVATNRDVTVRMTNATSRFLTLERSTNVGKWEALSTLKAPAADFVDTGASYREQGFYRALALDGTNVLTGDELPTDNGNLTIHPVNHASFVMAWNGLMIYNDPVGGATPYKDFPRADLILVSHDHSDHFDAGTLSAVRKTNGVTILISPRAVYNALNAQLKAITTVLTNGASTNTLNIQIDAVPAYNSNHPKGTGNGYVLSLGGKRLYMTGDTGALNEMKALTNIDVAFVCMNVPYTMSVSQASGIVREFAPRMVYPYHYRNQDNSLTDLNVFRRQVATDRGIEVRARKWY